MFKPTVPPNLPSETPGAAARDLPSQGTEPAAPILAGSGTVTPGFPLSIPRTRHTATLLQNGKILVVGGSVEDDDFAFDEELIDPVTGSSSWAAPLHTIRHDHTATLLQDGRVLVVGGYNLPDQWIHDAEIYNPQANTWTVLPPNHTHGTSHTATLLKDGRVLVVGGCIGSGVCTNRVEIFDPRSNLWMDAAPLQNDRFGHTAQLLDDGRVLVAGGSSALGKLPADEIALVYDPFTNSWASLPSMNVPRYMVQSVKLSNGDVLVAGGFLAGMDPLVISSAVEIYRPETNTWRPVASLNQARYAFTLRLLASGQVIAIAGSRESDCCWSQDSFVQAIEMFDPATEQWRVIGSLPEPGAFATGTQLKDGRIWIAGGQVGNRVLDKTWLVQP